MYHQLRNLSKKLAALPLMLLTLCVLTGWSFTASAAQAPDGPATGVVLDQDGEPMPGASVMVVGTTLGGSTNVDGKFSIANVKNGATLRISFVGCKP
ncbi:MAG: carboxypeptidase-like regulatory domain-containing protein, partial [Paramuribaculum sp.]|nr:carboxypeptidase-like regulatory domain-containing protein [Paramuribaculum sp.]